MIKFLNTAWLALIVLATSVAVPAIGKTVEVSGPNRIEIVGGIAGAKSLSTAQDIEKLAKKDDGEPIEILLNSPGGDIVMGNFIVNAIKLAQVRGHEVRCYVGSMAASMAFMILAECDKRYALNHARLLWHPGRAFLMMAALTAEDGAAISEGLARENEEVLNSLYTKLPAPKAFILKHFKSETLWDARALDKAMPNFITVVDDIRGFESSLFDIVGELSELGFNSPLLKELLSRGKK